MFKKIKLLTTSCLILMVIFLTGCANETELQKALKADYSNVELESVLIMTVDDSTQESLNIIRIDNNKVEVIVKDDEGTTEDTIYYYEENGRYFSLRNGVEEEITVDEFNEQNDVVSIYGAIDFLYDKEKDIYYLRETKANEEIEKILENLKEYLGDSDSLFQYKINSLGYQMKIENDRIKSISYNFEVTMSYKENSVTILVESTAVIAKSGGVEVSIPPADEPNFF